MSAVEVPPRTAGGEPPGEGDRRLIALGIDEIPGAAFLVFDGDMRYVLARGAAIRDNAMDPDSLEGRRVPEALAPDRWANLQPMYEAALRGNASLKEVASPSGHRRYLVRTGPVRGDRGEILGGVSVATDVTELRRVQEALAASERTKRLTFDSAPIGMALVGLDRRFLDVNVALCRMLGRSRQWLLSHGFADVLDPTDDDLDRAARDQVLAGGGPVTTEKRLITVDGHAIWVMHSVGLVVDDRGTPLRFVSQFADITEARHAREDMRWNATHDHLTRLPNRARFAEQLASTLAHRARTGGRIAVLFIDLDGFKAVNDTYGHVVGDDVLAEVAERIRGQLRVDDLVARYGGDEFVALLPSVRQQADAVEVADSLRRAVAAPLLAGDDGLVVTVSIGVAVADPGARMDELMRRADAGMYRAKDAGGDRVEVVEVSR